MLMPALTSGTDAYTAFVPFSTASIVLTPTTQDGEAAVTVNGTNVDPGSASEGIAVSGSTSTVITIVVTAKDGTTTRTIELTIIRFTAIESWRHLYFGSPTNAGAGADSATPQLDGVTNLMKFATAMDSDRARNDTRHACWRLRQPPFQLYAERGGGKRRNDLYRRVE